MFLSAMEDSVSLVSDKKNMFLPVFDFSARPSAQGRQFYCQACNFRECDGSSGRQLS